MSYKLPSLSSAEVVNKKVFLRMDLDVPIGDHGTILDDTRIEFSLPTINYLVKRGGSIIIGSHLGRPNGPDRNLSLAGVGHHLKDMLGIPGDRFSAINLGGFNAFKIGERIILLENLRFYPGEEIDDPEFARKLASLADIYVNEAFASSHRNHASITGIPKILPHFAGFRLEKEVKELSEVLESPKRPLAVIVGGAKIETKLPLITKMHGFADYVIVGGELAKETKTILKIEHEKVARKSKLIAADLTGDGLDINEQSLLEFTSVLKDAKTIIWNGPMGKISNLIGKDLESEKGTRELANFLIKSSARTIVGGGDTVGFLKKERLLDKFSFVSTGGGAMLEFLAGEKLPGLEALLIDQSSHGGSR